MDWRTTSTLLSNLRDYDNRAAWERFARRFRRPIVVFARRLGLSETDAEDAAQDAMLAFARAYRDGGYDATRGRLSHWLFGIAYRRILQARRTAARREEALPGDGAHVPAPTAVSALWDREWERALLDECLRRAQDEVEPATFRAFELVVRFGRPVADVAHELGIAPTTVYNAKHRVVKRIRALREEYEATEDAREGSA